MPAGLQVFNEAGVMTVDLTSRLGRILGYAVVADSSGSRSVPGFSTGTPFAFAWPGPETDDRTEVALCRPLEVVISGTTLSWHVHPHASWPASAGQRTRLLVYGVY